MTYQEAIEKALTVRWKTITCDQGDDCWCRGISPERSLTDNKGDEIHIIPIGTVRKEHAEHIVRLHNNSL